MVLIEPFNFSFFSITGRGIDLDYCDIEWFAKEANRDHSVVFETASKYQFIKGMLKNTNEEIHRVKSGRILSLNP